MAVDGNMRIHICKEVFVTWTLVMPLSLFVLVCHTVFKKACSSFCTVHEDPLPIFHEFYQPGDLVIGGIVSQVFSIQDTFSFKKQPRRMSVGEPV